MVFTPNIHEHTNIYVQRDANSQSAEEIDKWLKRTQHTLQGRHHTHTFWEHFFYISLFGHIRFALDFFRFVCFAFVFRVSVFCFLVDWWSDKFLAVCALAHIHTLDPDRKHIYILVMCLNESMLYVNFAPLLWTMDDRTQFRFCLRHDLLFFLSIFFSGFKFFSNSFFEIHFNFVLTELLGRKYRCCVVCIVFVFCFDAMTRCDSR